MKFLYLDKKDRFKAWFRVRRVWVCVAVGALTLFVPLWHESVEGRFLLEPARRAVVRNPVAGTITDVLASEGMYVAAGAPLLRLYNVPLESKVASSASDYAIASLRTAYAAIHYEDLGAALQERQQLTTQTQEMQEEASNLELRSPIAGTVLTPRLSDWQGAYAREGTELVEVADLSQMRARVYVSDYEMYKLHVGSRARINIEGIPRLWSATAAAITPVSTDIDPGIADTAKYKGLNTQNYYLVDLMISNPEGVLKPGVAGVARIYGPRRSVASHMARELVRFFGRKLW